MKNEPSEKIGRNVSGVLIGLAIGLAIWIAVSILTALLFCAIAHFGGASRRGDD